MTILKQINKNWNWLGICAVEVLDQNKFGNILFRNQDGTIWRIIPESPECLTIAKTETEYKALIEDSEFQADWRMDNLVKMGEKEFGELVEGMTFCLKIPAILGGHFDLDNMGTIPQSEQIRLSGDIARQISGMPEGTKVKLNLNSGKIEKSL